MSSERDELRREIMNEIGVALGRIEQHLVVLSGRVGWIDSEISILTNRLREKLSRRAAKKQKKSGGR